MKKILISILCLITINVQGQTEEERIDKLSELAYDYCEDGKFREAIPYLDTLVNLEPDYYFYYATLSDIHFDLKEYGKGLEYIEKAYEREKSEQLFYLLIYRYFQTFNEDKALKLFDSIPPNIAQSKTKILFTTKALCYRALGEYDKAFKVYKELLKLRPNSSEALTGMGFVYEMTGNEEESIYYYQLALEKDQTEYEETMILISLKKYDEAEAILDTLINKTKEERVIVGWLNIKGVNLMAQKKFKQAAKTFKKALSLDNNTDMAKSRNFLAYCEIRDSNYQNALNLLDTTIQVFPNFYDAIANRARALMKLGKFDEALKEVNKAIELKPKRAYAYMVRGMIAFEQDHYETACVDYFNATGRYGDYLHPTEEFFIDIYWFCN